MLYQCLGPRRQGSVGIRFRTENQARESPPKTGQAESAPLLSSPPREIEKAGGGHGVQLQQGAPGLKAV